jgi:nucleotide-binding universal stress UspA family protein
VRIVVGIDWSEESFTTVQQVLHVFRPTQVALVHGVSMGLLEYPSVAQAANFQGYDELRRALTEAGRQVLDRAASMLPSGCEVTKVNEVGNPGQIILDTAESIQADLVAVGTRGRGQLAEIVLGSVSHRVLMHARRPTLVVKGGDRRLHKVLVAVEGKDDGERITQWLMRHPFAHPVELCIISVVVPLHPADPYSLAGLESWPAVATTHAEEVVKTVSAGLSSPQYTTSIRVLTGEVAAVVADLARDADLVVVASHGRHRLERLLLGSASHAIVHRVAVPTLVIR